jgi:hypothetical protein
MIFWGGKGVIGVWTQGLTLTRQVLSTWATPPAPDSYEIFTLHAEFWLSESGLNARLIPINWKILEQIWIRRYRKEF